MSVQSLAQQAGLKIPVKNLFFAREHEGNVINQEFMRYVKLRRSIRRQEDLVTMCKVCKQDGDCLCYLFQIRHMMIDCYWCTEDDYKVLGDWLTLSNQHAAQ